MVSVFSDFNCPFCYVQHIRLLELNLRSPVNWFFIEHAPYLSSSINDELAMSNLIAEVTTAKLRAPDIDINQPEFCVNTRIAILSYTSVWLNYPDKANQYLSGIYTAYWRDGKDISDTAVLKALLNKLNITEFSLHSKAEKTQNDWQKMWLSDDLDERIPAISSNEASLLGLQHPDNILGFIDSREKTNKPQGLTCIVQEKSKILIFTNDSANVSALVNPQLFEITYLQSVEGIYAEAEPKPEYKPDLIIIDYAMDKAFLYQMLEKITSSVSPLKDIPFVYFIKSMADTDSQVMAFDLGAIDIILGDENQVVISSRIKRRVIESRKLVQLSQNSVIDPLTGVYNRREMDVLLEKFWRLGCRNQIPLAIVLMDIDYFKHYNDYYGHLQGDECLIKVAGILQTQAQRGADVVARFGGEEFVIVLFDVTATDALKIAERMRKAIEDAQFPQINRDYPQDKLKVVTASFGVCTLQPHADLSPNQAIELADQALYQSKSKGRNQVSHSVLKPPKY